MKCIETTDLFDDYIAESLPEPTQLKLASHLESCSQCQLDLQEHRAYLKCMAEFKTPRLDSGRAANMLRLAAIQGEQLEQKRVRKSSFIQGFVAASVMALAVSFGVQQFNHEPQASQAYVANYGVNAQEIALVINAPFDMNGAELVLSLPADVSIQGQEHLATVTWSVDLSEGANRIVLPVQFEPFAEFAEELMLTASLRYQDGRKDFQVDLQQGSQAMDSHSAQTQPEGVELQNV